MRELAEPHLLECYSKYLSVSLQVSAWMHFISSEE